MADLAAYGIDLDTLRRMYDAWCAGAKKSELERRYLNAPQSHGKLFSSLVREHLGIETERRAPQTERVAELEAEVQRLRELLRARGVDTDNAPSGGGEETM
jgi:hypothetical protein